MSSTLTNEITDRVAACVLGAAEWTVGELVSIADTLGADAARLLRLTAGSEHLACPRLDRLAERVGQGD